LMGEITRLRPEHKFDTVWTASSDLTSGRSAQEVDQQ
jgi:hypothetical protein